MEFISAHKDSIKNELTISVTGQIGWDFAGGDVISYLRNFTDNTEKLSLDFFSFGGNVFDAIAVYEFLTTNGYGNVEANIYGFCGSAATVIACAAQTVNMGQHSFFFVHNAYDGMTGEQNDQTAKVSEQVAQIYKKKTGLNLRLIRKLMNEGDSGALLGAAEAKDYGFIDNIIKEKISVAAAWGERFTGQKPPNFIHSNTETMNFNLIEWVQNAFKAEVNTEEEAQKFLEEKAPAMIKADGTEGGTPAGDARIDALESTMKEMEVNTAKAEDVATIKKNMEAMLGKISELAEAVKTANEAVAVQANAVQANEDDFQKKLDDLGANIQALRAFTPKPAPADAAPAVVADAKNATENPNVVVSTAADAVINKILGRAGQSN